MKKGIIGIIALVALSFSASSCCKKCTNSTFGITVDVCEKDFNSNADYNNAISTYEIAGYTCQ